LRRLLRPHSMPSDLPDAWVVSQTIRTSGSPPGVSCFRIPGHVIADCEPLSHERRSARGRLPCARE
jgi:hypothetical protein